MMIQGLLLVAKMRRLMSGSYTRQLARLAHLGVSSWRPRSNLALLRASSLIVSKEMVRVPWNHTSMLQVVAVSAKSQ